MPADQANDGRHVTQGRVRRPPHHPTGMHGAAPSVTIAVLRVRSAIRGEAGMHIDLSSKRAVVSGSTAGIGFAVAEGLGRSGAAVVVNGRTQARVDRAVAKLRDAPGLGLVAISGVAADLGTAAGAAKFIEAVPDCDILVNNLGIYEVKPFLEITDEDWLRLFETNVMSGVRLTRAYLPGMLSRRWGRIVFVSSESAVNIPQELIHYGMTKTAQLAVSRGVAESVAGSGVTVNAVLPGPTRSEGIERYLAEYAARQGSTVDEVERDFFREVRPTSLIRRFASIEEVANMVVYACSAQASATSGAALRVDGGVVRGVP
jgi:NAD(P)-dependent dehydrogenase (short-subunit alcohol dehydrogenase family)